MNAAEVTLEIALPTGAAVLVANARGICALRLRAFGARGGGQARRPTAQQATAEPPGSDTAASYAKKTARAAGWLQEAAHQLEEYFLGQRREFDLPLDLTSATDFQRRVLERCRKIPYGTTISYGELARSIGRPTAARAVGQVMARNPLPILIPCHRVIGAAGQLGGYGPGPALKARLLAMERAGVAWSEI